MAAKTITDGSFEADVINSEQLVVLDFWAQWCGPCKMISPIVEELAEEFTGKAVIGKVDVDANQELPMKYSVRSIPTLLFIKNGEVVDRQVGALSKDALKSKIEKHLQTA